MGVGASAGGLQAFSELLAALPASPQLAIVFVPHLDRTRHSLLPQLLAHAGPMAVEEARDGVAVKANRVYVTPAGRWIAILRGKLHLLPQPPEDRLAIDGFFRSLAADQKQNSIGVVLSGTGADGASGLSAIRAQGGITIAQEEASARFPSIPKAAVESGCVDLVLAPHRIAELLVDLSRHPDRGARLSAFDAAQSPLSAILALVRGISGVDFEQYRTPLIQRRIQRRMALLRLSALEAYLRRLRQNKAELEELIQDLLSAVTSRQLGDAPSASRRPLPAVEAKPQRPAGASRIGRPSRRFFRDPEAWAALAVAVAAMRKQRADGPLRAWVAGCGTGEEAYTLAIALMELGGQASQLQIFATDARDALLTRARAGTYPESISRDVNPERLRRFFRHGRDGRFQVIKPLRDACIFARHDLLREAPFPNLDIITCRNVLIYLKPPAQRRLTAMFHYALRPHGLLMLGAAGGIAAHSELFQPADRKHRIYAPRPALSANQEIQSVNEELQTSKEELKSSNEELGTINDELRARNLELNQFTSDLSNLMDSLEVPMVMLDRQCRIRHFTPAADEVFYLMPTDLNRPIDEIRAKVELPDLRGVVAEVIATGRQSEATITAASGRTYLLRVKPYRNLRNEVEGAVLRLLDTTLRREADRNPREKQFAESVVRAFPQPLVVLEGTRIVSANSAFARLFTPQRGDLEGQSLARLPGWDRRELQAWVARATASEEPQRSTWEGGFGAAGRRVLRISSSPFQPSGTGGRLTLLAVADETEHQREEQRRRAFEKLAFAGRMAAALAHEINNPLEALNNLLYLARRSQELPAPAADYLQRAEQELARVIQITRDALGLFRDSGLREMVALPALFADLQVLFASRIKNKHVELRIEADGQPETLAAFGLSGELRRLFANLLANALDATPARGPVRVRIRAANQGVLVIVADRGAGIPAAERGHVFEPFYSTKGKTGAGLGLWVAAEIVKRHAGWIRLHSRPAKRGPGHSGTAVGVWLPGRAE